MSLWALVEHLSHFMGTHRHPAQARFFMIPCLPISPAPLALIRTHPTRYGPSVLLGVAAAVLLAYFPIAVRGSFIDRMLEVQATKRYVRFQWVQAADGTPGKEFAVDPSILLETIDEQPLDRDWRLRISRVVR